MLNTEQSTGSRAGFKIFAALSGRSVFVFGLAPAIALHCLSSLAPLAAQTTVVDWGGDYVSERAQGFQNKRNTSTFAGYGGFQQGEALALYPDSGYEGTSAKFYGSIQEINGENMANSSSVVNNGARDFLRLKGDDATQTAFLLLWQSDDFLGDARGRALKLSGDGSIRLNLRKNVGGHAEDSGRLVFRINDAYYISEQVYSDAGVYMTSGDDIFGMEFYRYHPSRSLQVDTEALLQEPVDLVPGGDAVRDGIAAVGFYFESSPLASGGHVFEIEEVGVKVEIPEPALYGTFLAFVGLWTVARRRRRP